MQLTGAERYNPAGLSSLEANVDEQVSKGTFDLDANLAVLRLYAINPATTSIPVVIKILLRAIAEMPGTQYRSCLQLLSERVQEEPGVARVIAMASALETSRHADFWQAAANAKDLIAHVPGFYEGVRGYITHSLQLSFASITRATLSTCLHLSPDSLNTWVQHKVATAGWSEAKGGEVLILPKGESNQLVIKRSQDVIRFDQVLPVLRAVTVGY